MLRVALVNGARRLECYAIVDSGADHCVFPRSFMQPLGLDPLTAPTEGLAGVGNQGVLTHFSHVTLDLQGMVQLPVFAGFTIGLEHWGLGLLGQSGFFERLSINFDLPRGVFEIDIPSHPR